MIAKSDIEYALSIQERSYKLLQWLSKAVREGFVPIILAHDVTGAGAAAKYWLQRQWLSLPQACRPAEEEMDAFANFFGTYLETSFDLDEKSRQRVVSQCGCYCAFCSRIVESRNLRAKSVSSRDKKRAAKLRLRRLEELALEAGIAFHEEFANSILGNDTNRVDTSISAYVSALLDRIQGFSDGPAVLALWRDFAWTSSGAPIRNFRLPAQQILDAESRLVSLLKS